MIIFSLDGTLADCEHRRHLVDPKKNPNCSSFGTHPKRPYFYNDTGNRFKPDWQAFHKACDKDTLIEPSSTAFLSLMGCRSEIEIWSGRSESVKEKTINWLNSYLFGTKHCCDSILKMRPIGDNTPDDQLKERWLDEAIAEGKTIDFVFDSDPKSILMWLRHGIFVFHCLPA